MVDISLVIPNYNGSSFIKDNLTLLNRYLNKNFKSYEIIVVDDGSTDQSSEAIKNISPQIKPIFLSNNKGKGFAVKTGMIEACGRCRIFTDADLPYDLEAIKYAAEIILSRKFHMVIGDRNLRNSIYSEKLRFLRKAATKIFTFFAGVFVTGGIFDTQCGFKAFRGDIAEELFPLLRNSGFDFDMELIFIALKYNMEIKKIPVRLQRTSKSTVIPVKDGIKMLGALLKLRKNWIEGKYGSSELYSICRIEYWEDYKD